MSRMFREKCSKISNLANFVYADVSKKKSGKNSKNSQTRNQTTQSSQKDFILVTHSKSEDYKTTIQVIEYKYMYNERLTDS